MEDKTATAYAAEFVGTFVLVLFIGIILSVQSGIGQADFAVIGLVHVFTLGMLIAALGGTSGAHFNPAVTAVLTVLRKIKPADAGIYVVMQLLGAVAAALVVKLLLGSAADAVNYGATGITANEKLISSDSAAFLAELIGTFVLVWAIMGAAVNVRAERAWAPWVIGGTLGMAVMCIGPLTGAGFNPARAFGPALVGDAFGGFGTFLYVYVGGPIVGALLAGLAYQKLVLVPETRPIDKLG